MTIIRAKVHGCMTVFALQEGLILEIEDDTITVLKQKTKEDPVLPFIVVNNPPASRNGH